MVVRRWGVQQGQLYARNYFPNDMKKLYHKDTKRTGDLLEFFFSFLFVTGSLRKNSQGETKILQRNLNGFSDILISFFLQPPAKKKFTENLYWQNSEYGINARGKINGKFILKIKRIRTVVFVVMHSADEFHWSFGEKKKKGVVLKIQSGGCLANKLV